MKRITIWVLRIYKLGKFDEAKESVKKALDINPSDESYKELLEFIEKEEQK